MPKPKVNVVKTRRKLDIVQLSELLFEAWKEGKLSDEVREYVAEGLIPIPLIKQELQWILERTTDGNILLTIENEMLNQNQEGLEAA